MSSVILAVVVILATVVLMEVFAWWAHRYVMHGWGWAWHKSHHEPHDHRFERNDLYAVVFAGIAIVLFWIGTTYWDPIWWVATGITLYGVLYFIAHDGLVHQRWPFRYVPKKGYLKRLYQAHRLHHAVKDQDGCVSFGFIWAPRVETLKHQLRANRRSRDLAMYESEDEAVSG